MDAKKAMVSTDLKKYLAIGGIGIALFGVSCFLWRGIRKHDSVEGNRLPKKLVIQILCSLKRELFPVLNGIAGESICLMKRLQLRTLSRDEKLKIIEKSSLLLL